MVVEEWFFFELLLLLLDLLPLLLEYDCFFREADLLPPRPLGVLVLVVEEEEEECPLPLLLVPLPRVLRNASVRSDVNWVNRKSSRYFIFWIDLLYW